MILISLGANIAAPDGTPPLLNCQRAAAALDALPGLHLRGLSRWYTTAPVLPAGAPAQPRFTNAVAHLCAEPGAGIDPAVLLQQLLALEARFGRVRQAPHMPRPLDLDIVAIDDLVRAAPDPVLPHPRAHLRAFVMVPLAEVAPGWVHPGLGQSVAAMIAALPAQQLQVLSSFAAVGPDPAPAQ